MTLSTHNSKPTLAAALLIAACGLATSAQAQWVPNYQYSSIQRIGLFDAPHTGSTGYQYSLAEFFSAPGFVAGYSLRVVPTFAFADNGRDTWAYSVATGETVQTGLVGAAYTNTSTRRVSVNNFQSAGGYVAGYTERRTELSTNGQDTWAFNPNTGLSVQTGLTGAEYRTSQGFQMSSNDFLSASGQAAGFTKRFLANGSDGGQSTWVFNPISGVSVRTGLTGPGYTDTSTQSSTNNFQNSAGQIAGWSSQLGGLGRSTWVYTPSTGLSTLTGLTGANWVANDGTQLSQNDFQNESGVIAGMSQRRRNGAGFNTWVYNPATGVSTQTGLTGPEYTAGGANTAQSSFNQRLSASGHISGYSLRYSFGSQINGRGAWSYDPTTQATTEIGLLSAEYTGSAGYRYGLGTGGNDSGQIIGISRRVINTNTENGQNAWVYSPSTGITTSVGFSNPALVGSAGYQFSAPDFINPSGQVAGYSQRITGVNTTNGQNTWVFDPGTGTTIQTGLLGAGFTGSGGRQQSSNGRQNQAGFVLGGAVLSPEANSNNGSQPWLYNPVTKTTVQIGLTAPANTGSGGFQLSSASFLNSVGQVAGYSTRYIGVSTNNGQDAWFYDPSTNTTSAIIGSVRASDNYAYAQPTILTEGGFTLGNYLFFADGAGAGERRAFIFRPDLGLTDLGALVVGGLTVNGWQTLRNPLFSDALRTIVGSGTLEGQLVQSESVFVLVPAPSALAIIGLAGLTAARRRQRGG